MTGIISLLNQLGINCWVPMMRSELFIHTCMSLFWAWDVPQTSQAKDLHCKSITHSMAAKPSSRFKTHIQLHYQTEYNLDEKQDDRCGYFSSTKVPGDQGVS